MAENEKDIINGYDADDNESGRVIAAAGNNDNNSESDSGNGTDGSADNAGNADNADNADNSINNNAGSDNVINADRGVDNSADEIGEGDLFETIVPRRTQNLQNRQNRQDPRPQPMPQRPGNAPPRPRPMPQRPGSVPPRPRPLQKRPDEGDTKPRTQSLRRKADPTEPRLPELLRMPQRAESVDTTPRTQALKRKADPEEPRLPELKRLPQRAQTQKRDTDAEPELTPLRQRRKRSRAQTYALRALLVVVTVIVVALVSVISLVRTVVTGPSETVRDMLVVSAMQASATKWLPKLFLDDSLVDEIIAKSNDVQQFTEPMTPYIPPSSNDTSSGDTGSGSQTGDDPVPGVDEWENAIDGMIYKTASLSNFKAYILIVRDPSRIYVGTSSDYKSGRIGSRIFDIVEREGAIAGINAGEFADIGGTGTGDNPIGLTYSKGSCVWDDGSRRTFIGFDNNGVLHAIESAKKADADALGIRDAVSFQTGNVLISNDGESVTYNYSEGNVGRSQRTAIAQRADGAVILVVTDGRTASSLGATRNEIIDLLRSEGAVTAGMLDGGSSTMMYYKDYYTKYNIDTSDFDEYQLQGLTNKYKAFTKPRHLPTFFLVKP